jgi:hypothetical protein
MEICLAAALGAASREGNGEEGEMFGRFPNEN